jgi:hypothetical protein
MTAPAETGLTTRPLVNPEPPSVVEQAVVMGDLARLTSAQRVEYYRRVCDSVGLNPFTRPFDYLVLNGKLTLYANRGASDQLRRLRGISIEKVERDLVDDVLMVTVYGRDKDGRVDTAIGAVPIEGLKGEAKANAMMKAETKAKRRLTLSLAGLGWLDESEVATISGVRHVEVDPATGEILRTSEPQELGSGSGETTGEPERDPARPAVTGLPAIPQGLGAETALGQVFLDGTIEVNDKQRTDGQLRQTPKGPTLGFRFGTANGPAISQVVARGDLATAIAERLDGRPHELNGIWATIGGEIYAVPWKKKNAETDQMESMPPSRQLHLSAIWTPGWSLPIAVDAAGLDVAETVPPDEPKQTTVADAVHEANTAAASGPGMTAEAFNRALADGKVAGVYALEVAKPRYGIEALHALTDAQRLELAGELGLLAEEE